jgi:hypothetical protein
MKIRILFINVPEEKSSIWSSGIMVYQALKLSDAYTLDYMELTREHLEIPLGYSLYLFNFHPCNQDWLNPSSVKKLPGIKATLVLEVLPDDPFPLVSSSHFDAYFVLDPTCRHRSRKVFAFPRPLELLAPSVMYTETTVPVVGTFGFGVEGKGIDHVVEAVKREFAEAVVRVNIPFSAYMPQDFQKQVDELKMKCKTIAGDSVSLRFSHDYMSKQELVDWCAVNTLNCFFYNRDQPGLSATTDQAILSGRPLAVSVNPTFRHLHAYIRPYPEWDLRETIKSSTDGVARMKEDWSPKNFMKRFEEVLGLIRPEKHLPDTDAGAVTLDVMTPFDKLIEKICGHFRRVPIRWWKRYVLRQKVWQRVVFPWEMEQKVER